MKLEKDISLEDFRDEMQHRVVKYPLRSRPVKEGLRFAKLQSDAAFHRIATDKIHAQKQFQRELNGPGKVERLVDFLMLGSLRELFVMMLLVVVGIAGVEAVKSFYAAVNEPEPAVDIDELAKKLNLEIGLYNDKPPLAHGSLDRYDFSLFEERALTDQSELIDRLAVRIAKLIVESGKLETGEVDSQPSAEKTKVPEEKADAARRPAAEKMITGTDGETEPVSTIDLAKTVPQVDSNQGVENE